MESADSNAWIVSVWTTMPEYEYRVLVAYAVGAQTKNEAATLVRSAGSHFQDDDINEPVRISATTAESLGITSGSVKMI
ncbi:hypothetical protein [Ahrensia marina]|uniref:Uncharacterized protein n=1 Tax=Ahrensia marina TaxID=1514904 RepID=A0A0M9GKJ9_9HYPH|nr:hypothetical protein [Ahrensia marina]KPA99956.1 hypothetical protein SU32_16250 [Ahrensia marina]